MCNVLYLQCPSDRSLAVEGCDCPSGLPGLPGLPGPMVRHCLTMHPSGLLRPFACYLIKTHIKLFTVWTQGFRGEKGREGPPGPDGKPVSRIITGISRIISGSGGLDKCVTVMIYSSTRGNQERREHLESLVEMDRTWVKHQEHFLIFSKLYVIILFLHLQGEAGEPGQKGERGLEGPKVCRFWDFHCHY